MILYRNDELSVEEGTDLLALMLGCSTMKFFASIFVNIKCIRDYDSRLPIGAILDWLYSKREMMADTGTVLDGNSQESMEERHLLISVNYYVCLFAGFFRRLASSILALIEQSISVKAFKIWFPFTNLKKIVIGLSFQNQILLISRNSRKDAQRIHFCWRLSCR